MLFAFKYEKKTTTLLCLGCLGVVVGHPLDTIKVRLQTRTDYLSFYQLVVKNQGLFTGLFNGIIPPLYCLTFVNAIVFGVYGNVNDFLKKRENNEDKSKKIQREFISGFIAGSAQCFVACPMELVKCRIQAYNGPMHQKNNLSRTIKKIREEGNLIRGIYRGFLPTLLRDAPGFAIYFSSFQFLIDLSNTQSEAKFFIAGGLAGGLSWVFTYPMDVIKTQLQINGTRYSHSMIICFKEMLEEKRGYKVFFKGYIPTLIRSLPVNAVTLYTVNKILLMYENMKNEQLK